MKFNLPALVVTLSSLLVVPSMGRDIHPPRATTSMMEDSYPEDGEEEIVECTVFTIAGSAARGLSNIMSQEYEYLCEVEDKEKRKYITYKIHGDINSFFPSYQSSQTTLTLPTSVIDENKVIDLNNPNVTQAIISVSNPIANDSNLSADRFQGSYKGLVIRVADVTGDAPSQSESELYGTFFEDSLNYGLSVRTVFLGCSDNKFVINPATGSAVNNGVITITVGYAISGIYYSDVSDAVLELLPSSGIDDYTYIMMVMPDSVPLSTSGGTAGKGSFPGTKTWYKSDSVRWVTLGVHELGHNLHQGHSGADDNGDGKFDDDDEEYDDTSCTMGGEWGDYTNGDGKKCFNAHKMYYLGWFSDYNGHAKPTLNAFGAQMVGINDAVNNEIGQDQIVTMKISDPNENDLFLMYNRVEGVHGFLEDDTYRDKIVIVDGDTYIGAQSWVLAVLDQGETYTKSNWAGTGKTLNIKTCNKSFGSPDYFEVGVWLDGVNSLENIANCEAAPTVSPAPTAKNTVLRYVGNPCDEYDPIGRGACQQCTGDCDYDSDCEGDMLCFQRSSNDPAPPGCDFPEGALGEEYKSDSSDYCYTPPSVTPAPVPTPPTPTSAPVKAPVETPVESPVETPVETPSSSTCVNSPLRLRVWFNGRYRFKDCNWIANNPGNRCKKEGMSEMCPVACGTCDTCADTAARFKVLIRGKKRAKDCSWANNYRCGLYDGLDETCRLTCGTCTP